MSTEETVEANAAAEERLYAGMTRRDVCNGCGACEAACISLESGSISANMDTRAIVVVSAKEA